ncbi:maltose phosphorylase [Dolosicoccus paucivorans]|uniref:Alpha-1,4 glucan phosphorylase n=1 Tax=Dolosicoccus paucivorans TaxID=84521 RepID=A0A2N6SLS6_9LACT|nr:glycogen/starch/alpha-glucan phosphorylase [Dolosicoccus paucivorans]PMB83886.1 maltose phosphorylase [Dolosicoccus paucivorans]PMC58028.1 maltose phosphorylase [Dolosicoccus paucivorans]
MGQLEDIMQREFDQSIKESSDQELYKGLLDLIQEVGGNLPTNDAKKKVYYVSAEFLIGKLLSNNLLNLGLYDEVEKELNAVGKSIADVEQAELEPSLGNGGLGRLAACFLDSMASLGINGDGVGLNYHFGLFKQLISDYQQAAVPDEWLTQETWLNKSSIQFEVPFRDFTLTSTLYDIDVYGYDQNKKNRLRLFDLDSVSADIIEPNSIFFDKTNIKENLTLFLYPDDSDHQGLLLRIYQQYFMVSNAAQLILQEAKERGSNLRDLADYAVIQINDTHPAFIIPELIRLLTTQHGLTFEEAVEVVKSTVAFTNHTILAEALEKWPMADIDMLMPEIAGIIRQLDQHVRAEFPDSPEIFIIDQNDVAHMASMAIHFGFSTNGVAALHTQILKTSELSHFYKHYPERFNNKTNGITFRRWIMNCNPELAELFDELLGEGWRKDHDLRGLLKYEDDKEIHARLAELKQHNKVTLKKRLEKDQGTVINENSIIDIQIKRFHEYKRQQMLMLYIVHKYFDIKKGNIPATPITILFGGKAAPAYTIAQDIMHTISLLSKLIEEDPDVSPHFQVVMVENYNVSKAEVLIPAADISEQISLASKEASGTGNMKFMLNGALTICTFDGANVEIAERVGGDNIYTFGRSSQDIVELYNTNGYRPQDYYSRPRIKPLVDFIVSDEMKKHGNHERLHHLHNDILSKDYFMALIDLEEFIDVKEYMYEQYEDQDKWMKQVVNNIAHAGFFSSDRTISDYNEDIWHLESDHSINMR